MIAKRTFPVRTAGALTAPLVRKLEGSSETDEQPLLEAASGPRATRTPARGERSRSGRRPTGGSVPRSPGGDATPKLDEPTMKQRRRGKATKEEQPSREGSQKQSKQSAPRFSVILHPFKKHPDEDPEEFLERAVRETKRGLIELRRANEESRG